MHRHGASNGDLSGPEREPHDEHRRKKRLTRRRGLWTVIPVAIGALALAGCLPPPPPPDPPAQAAAPAPDLTMKATPICGAAPLAVEANAFPTDPADITGYTFDFGDGTVLNRPPAWRTADHTYPNAGNYMITMGANTVEGGHGSVTQPISVVPAQALPRFPLSVGYADNSSVHHAGAPGMFPSPWQGSPNVNYVGTDSDIDAGAIKIDNPTGSSIGCVSVRVQIGVVTFDLWRNLTLPANGSLILTETAHQNFDTSDTSDAGPCDAPSASQPVITVWSPGGVYTYTDTGQVLNTGGTDSGHCPPPPTAQAWNESHPWAALS
jgi:PKD repeat protein